jgi:hypothetical protein
VEDALRRAGIVARVDELPITPERVHELIRAARD